MKPGKKEEKKERCFKIKFLFSHYPIPISLVIFKVIFPSMSVLPVMVTGK